MKEKEKISRQLKKPMIPGIILLFVIIIGTIGYGIIWDETDSTIIDEIYMTFITITTIGYNEIYPLDTAGRIFTILIGVSGIGSLFYLLTVFMENLVIMQLSNYRGKKRRMKKIEELKDHIILVGFGRVGKLAASQLFNRKQDFVLIEYDDKEEDLHNFNSNMLYVIGDATQDETLLRAGIERAKGMIVATAKPSTTVFVVLSSKVLNPDLFIVARTDNEDSIEKLKRAGANRVVNPYAIGGQRLANLMVSTNVVDFIDTSFGSGDYNLSIENIIIDNNRQWVGKSLKDIDIRKNTGATILAIIRNDNPILNPDGNFKIKGNDQLVAFGTSDQLKILEKKALGE